MNKFLTRFLAATVFASVIVNTQPMMTSADEQQALLIRKVEKAVWNPPLPEPFSAVGNQGGFWGAVPDFDIITVAEFNEENWDEDPGVDPIIVGSIQPGNDEVNKYCINILDDAKEARHAVLAERLSEMQASADVKLDELDVRIAELRGWMEKRQQFLDQAKESLVQIFQTMRPDSAALQLTEMDSVMAAAIIAKLEPKYSSAILAEMDPGDAAKIAMMLLHAVALDD